MLESDLQSVVGIGELLWDCFPDGRRPGGAPANVAFHAALLGLRGSIVSRVGDDGLGRELCAELRQRGLATEWVQVDGCRPTGRVTVDTSDPGSPAYRIHGGVAWEALEFDPALEALVSSAAAVSVGTLAQRAEPGRTTIRRCLDAAREALTVFDVNLRPDGYNKEWIVDTLRRVRIVKLNLDEVAVLAPMLETGSTTPEGLARVLIERHGLELVAVTRGERGCIVVSGGETVEVAGRPAELADAVGAGDAFTAALIFARLRGFTLEATARFANAVGALVASRRGAMPDVRAELTALLRRHAVGQHDG